MLKLADNLSLQTDVVTQKLAWIGTTGSGKTYGASKLAELLYTIGAQFVALDPVGVWYGLRLAKDGKKPSDIKVPIFGGLHGDIPLEASSGALMADLVVDQTLSAILDVSQFESDAEKARFAAAFADRFFFRKKGAPSAVHLFLEECQEFVPENHQRGEERMKHAFTRMQKIGRNFGIGTSLITQRPQEVSKKALNLAQTLFVFRTTGTHERKAIEAWIKDKAIAGQDIAGDLPKLKTGMPHVWSPEWLEVSGVVSILEKRTFNASATPEVGKAAQARELAHIDLEKIRGDMAATIEKAKADDPRELRKTIAALENQLKTSRTNSGNLKESPPKVVEKPVITDAQLAKIDAHITRCEKAIERAGEVVKAPMAALTGILSALGQAVKTVRQPQLPMAPVRMPAAAAAFGERFERAGRVESKPTVRAESVKRPDGDLRESELRVLDSLAWWETTGIQQPSRHQTAFAAKYSVNGNFNNILGGLRTAGLIEYPKGDHVSLTVEGRLHTHTPGSPIDREALIAMVQAVIRKESPRRVFSAVVAAGAEISREALATACGYSVNGNFNNILGGLRSLGVIQYPRGNHVALSEMFDAL